MKKLIMIMTVVIMALTINAATVKWTMTNIDALTDSKGTTLATSGTFTGFTAYLIDSALSNADLLSAIKDGTLANNASVMETSALSNSRGDIRINFTGTKDYAQKDSDESTITYSFYTVIVSNDGSAYLQTGVIDSTVPDKGNLTFAFAVDDVVAGQYTWNEVASSGGGDVPEPTTGLLLLVGGALLALRRKQK